RTMSSADRGFNPLAYHNGTVWPHDNSLIAWGLARSGRWPEAHRIIRQMLTAGRHFDYQLPEVFAGLPRTETRFPIAYPTAAPPQAGAAGTPVLLLQLLLGLVPDRVQNTLETVAPTELPAWAGSLRLSGGGGAGRPWGGPRRGGGPIPQPVGCAPLGPPVGGPARRRGGPGDAGMTRHRSRCLDQAVRALPVRPFEMTGRHVRTWELRR